MNFLVLWLSAAAWAESSSPEAIYMVLVDRFENGNTRNDGTTDPADPSAFHGGDLAGVTASLDHIEGLGFSHVWLSPITKMRTVSIGSHGAFHGYWVENDRALEPRFGTHEELRDLTQQLGQRHMGLILDVVTNHVAPGAPLTEVHPDWFHDHGDIKDWSDPAQVITHDVHGLPDLAQELPAVEAHLIQAGLHWLDLAQPAGFRIDAVRHLPPAFVRAYGAAMRADADRDFRLLGEIFEGNPVSLARSAAAYGLDHSFDFPLHYAIVDVVCRNGDPRQLASVLSMDWTYPEPHTHLTFLDNHDLPRIRTACGGDEQKVAEAMTLLLLLRGIPVMTYGTEAGMSGQTETEARGDMDFQRVSPVADVVRQGLELRQAHPDLATAPTLSLWSGPGGTYLIRPGTDQLYVIGLALPGQTTRPPSSKTGEFKALLPPGRVGLWRHTGADRLAVLHGIKRLPQSASVPMQILPPVMTLQEGATLWLAGQDPALGAWSTDAALGPLVAGHPQTLQVRQGTMLTYKLFIRDASGQIEWAPEGNRYRLIEHMEPAQGYRLQLEWPAP